MKWFRMYTDVLDDVKINSISPFSFKIFVFLMSILTSEDHSCGKIPDEKSVSWRLRVGGNKLKKAIDELEKYGMVKRDNGAIIVVNWDKRQFKSDDVTARVKQHRVVTKAKNETLPETLHETPPEQNRTDTDTEQIQTHIKKRGVDKLYGFDAFWAAYPKKQGKGAAEKVWVKIKPDLELVKKMVFTVERQRNWQQWKKDGGQFIPLPATWLNQKRWDDEIPVTALPSDRPGPNETLDQFDARREAAHRYEMEQEEAKKK
jgi:DNA-binding transcriptional regulator YhcF (GntR family)